MPAHFTARATAAPAPTEPEVADVRTSVIYEHLRNHAVAPAAQP